MIDIEKCYNKIPTECFTKAINKVKSDLADLHQDIEFSVFEGQTDKLSLLNRLIELCSNNKYYNINKQCYTDIKKPIQLADWEIHWQLINWCERRNTTVKSFLGV